VTGAHEPAQGTRSSTIVVGHASERAIIDARLGDAERGLAAAVVFAGPAGIGKSALVDDAIRARTTSVSTASSASSRR
jgi:putative ribosome biogenesis GTPase RsgA